ncbi:MAG TPA: hypothetical protein VNO70_21940 [Blastocatellia bacterium]|nr:hypothetical protein [Blastocatellia bacterium]
MYTRNNPVIQTFVFMALLMLAPCVKANQCEIPFPREAGVLTDSPDDLAFAYEGQIGYTLLNNPDDGVTRLFSFSVTECKVLDQFDLSPDFGVGLPNIRTLLKVHSKTGLILIYGFDSTKTQKVLALKSDETGHLGKLWVASYSTVPSSLFESDVEFDEEGLRVYVIHFTFPQGSGPASMNSPGGLYDSVFIRQRPALRGSEGSSEEGEQLTAHVTLLNATTGESIDTVDLPKATPVGDLFHDPVRNRLLATTAGDVYIFSPASAPFFLESTIKFSEASLFLSGLSRDGRFLVAYGGYILPTGESTPTGSNSYYSFDLDAGTFRELLLKGKYAPAVTGLTFDHDSDTLFVPYAAKIIKESDDTFKFVFRGSRQIDAIKLQADGSLNRIMDVKLPKRSPGSQETNLIGGANRVVLSPTGAIGFIPTSRGRLFSFDTLTGEIVNDQSLNTDKVLYVKIIVPTGQLLFNDGRLVFVDIETKPVITGVAVRKKRTVIKGANFLSGARVTVNGEDMGVVERSPENPGREMILNRGSKSLPAGPLTFVVVNRDGLSSTPFLVSR